MLPRPLGATKREILKLHLTISYFVGESWRQIGKMAGYFSTGQSPQQAVVLMEEEEDPILCYIVVSLAFFEFGF